MPKKIRVLLIIDEVWDDIKYANNNMSNWFAGFDQVELATVYCSPGIPSNTCCHRYFQITDLMMLKSIFTRQRAGKVLSFDDNSKGTIDKLCKEISETVDPFYFFKKTSAEFFRLIQDCLWMLGRYNLDSLCSFINEFQPDLVFSQRKGSVKLCRLERIIKHISGLPMIAFTGDDEYSLGRVIFSPFGLIRQFMVRLALNKTIPLYSMYYTSSEDQAAYYHKRFNIPARFLVKCGAPNNAIVHKKFNTPIKIVYAGKLYCGRWKTLARLAVAIKKVNKERLKIELDIYTRDKISCKQKKVLHDGVNINLCGAVSPIELSDIYQKADIALHVESLDKKNRLVTRHSFSTKVIDCLSSGCAVMVIGWEKHSACIQMKKNNAAFVIDEADKYDTVIRHICDEPSVIKVYAQRAMDCVRDHYSKEKTQNSLFRDFENLIKKNV